MSTDYLKLNKYIQSGDAIGCFLTNNTDERYTKAYPKISSKDVINLASQYSLDDYCQIKTKIKNHFKIKTKIVLGSGSEELIIRLNDIVESKKYKIAFVTPLFYRVRETFHGEKFCIEEKDLFNFDFSNYDVVWLQNPNLFSGIIYSFEKIQNLLHKFPKVIFFIDEAGIFTLSNWREYSMVDKCGLHDNAVILSTFSKIYGVPGLRIGFASGNNKLLSILEEKNLTFPISSFAEYCLSNILDHEDLINKLRLKIIDHKNQLIGILKLNSQIVIKESLTNCLFFKHKNKKIYNFLYKEGLLCLDLDEDKELKDRGYVRMTVHSSEAVHRKVLIKLKKVILNI